MIEKERLQTKINEMITYFPWYRDYLSSMEPDDLLRLPLITREILEKHYYHQDFNPAWKIYQTSGTSSRKRKKIVYSKEDDQEYLDKKVHIYARFLQDKPIRTAMSDMGTGHAANTAMEVFKSVGLICEDIPYHLPVQDHVKLLKQFRPDCLYTMPSILESVLSATDHPEQFGIQKVILVGEVASAQWQNKVASRLRIDRKEIMDTYGSIEIGTIAYYSHEHGCYLFVEGLVPEGIRAEELGLDEDLLREDERILALTSFSRKTFPAVRFVTYDVVRGFKPIHVAGKMVPSFKSLVKRVGTEWKHGEKISFYDIEEAAFRYLDKATIWIQVDHNKLLVWIDSPYITDFIRKQIQVDIQDQIPEIGIMIRNGILDEIQVNVVTDPKQFQTDRVKKKVIHHKQWERH
ncbi:phenylacetate-CoA ligase [Baia soyae]|uniref:Phenylacetate-CoA ligase n=2 Tax=Baia soyae TaxID=1544746 RepID=A0A4R2S3C3_9BACL|nr:phenylacetate-CoA ligase [Baia soyae]